MDTNILGTMRCIKGVLPHFRSLGPEGGATIVNIGSLVNLTPFPSCTAYSASKMAVEGLSDALATEVGSAGIRVVLIDLGIFRTSFLHSFQKPKAGLGEAYVGGAVDGTVSFLEGLAGKQPGNPVLAAKRIVEVVDGTGPAKDLAKLGYGKLLRVPLGSDAFKAFTAKIESLEEVRSSLETLAGSTDFAQDGNSV
jgi:NAD(P)-dependent dehydrogenase (short-subunit alcohol dehydrogenase family)